jgi:undecaprenyl-diphosphatase
MVVALVASVYALIPQFTDLRGAADQIVNAQWGWVALAVLVTPLMYLGAASSLSGAAPDPVRPVPTFLTQVASSFTTKLAPSTVGGITLNIRFLQRQGADRAVAVTAVGVNSVSGFIVHTLLLVAFAAGAGRSDDVRLPKPEALVIGVVAVVLISAVAFAVPSIRRVMAARVLPGLRQSGQGILGVLRRPGDLVRLVGGNVVVVASLVASFILCAKAFGDDLRLVALVAAYLVGSSVSIIAPTPGGLGAVEVALVGALVAAGTPDKIAVPAVFLFRVITFWIPMLPGWLSLRWLRHRELA